MKTVVFAGAGVSSELGVPAMRSMAESFLTHLRDTGYSEAVLAPLRRLLETADFDMENVIDDLDSAGRGAVAGARWGLATAPETSELAALRAEAEWLVSHLCERVDAVQSAAMWGPLLRRASGDNLTIATTNYDRAIEQAALAVGTPIADGFPPFAGAELVPWQGFNDEGHVRLLKIHGSTDWYHEPAETKVWKLRHAMPLFGAVRVAVRDAELSLGSALVLPSREKRVTLPPYPGLAFEFRKAVDAADLVAFVGSSLRDPDLADLAGSSAERRPTIVVGRSVRTAGAGRAIQMSASRFLVSVAPRMLSAGTTDDAMAIAESEAGRVASILAPYRIALDTGAPPDDRCSAVELLAADRLALSQEDIAGLLRDPSDAVRTFALGLVNDSQDRLALMTLVNDVAAAEPASAFAREAAYLERPSSS